MRIFLAIACLLSSTVAYAFGCDNRRDIEQTLDLSDARSLRVLAAAGDLEIRGASGIREARIKGKVCASSDDLSDQVKVLTQSGAIAEITVVLPDLEQSGFSWGERHALVDLELEVPDDLPLEIKDSSGDMRIQRVAEVNISDSSGDIDVEDVSGSVVLRDSSGDIDLLDVDGAVTIESDSSGDIYGRNIMGSVVIETDSSGDIRFEEIGEDLIVKRDSSGDIVADRVGGDFRVLRDGSGTIRGTNVDGEIDIPDKS